jgi:hypothetical protein
VIVADTLVLDHHQIIGAGGEALVSGAFPTNHAAGIAVKPKLNYRKNLEMAFGAVRVLHRLFAWHAVELAFVTEDTPLVRAAV